MGLPAAYLSLLWLALLTSQPGGDERIFSIGYVPRGTSKTELRAAGWFLLFDNSGISLIRQSLKERVEDESALAPLVDRLPKRWRVKHDPSVELIPAPWTDTWPTFTWRWNGLSCQWTDDAGELGVEGDYRFTQIQLNVPSWVLLILFG